MIITERSASVKAYRNKNNYDQAIKDCSFAIELDQRFPKSYWIRGVAHVGKGQFVEARRDFESALQLDGLTQDDRKILRENLMKIQNR